MTDKSKSDDSNGFSRRELVDSQLLHTEYEQAGEEYRYRDKLLHNSYYLLIIVTAFLAGPLLRYIGQGTQFKLGIVVFAAGGLYTLLGMIILTHYVQRNSAASLRTRVEQIADGSKDQIPRPFAVQYRIIGQDSRMNDKGEIERAQPFFERVVSVPEYLHSAGTLAQFVLIIGILLLIAGVYFLTSQLPFAYTISFTTSAFILIVLFILWLRNIGSDKRFR